jgi:hypothetical protein
LELYSFVKEQKNQNQFGAKRSFNLSVDHFLRVLHHELASRPRLQGRQPRPLHAVLGGGMSDYSFPIAVCSFCLTVELEVEWFREIMLPSQET